MPLQVRQFPVLKDNYGFLIRDEATGKTGCVDTPDAKAILAELDSLGWRLDMILNTHWHPDHAGGNEALKARAEAVFAARDRGEPTVPTRIGLEKAANPFLRAPELRPGLPAAEAFAEVRRAKDVFAG